MAMPLEEVEKRIRLSEAKVAMLQEALPKLKAKRDYADKHESAQIWYHANVKVRTTIREILKEKETLSELKRKREKRIRNGKN